MTDQPLFTTEDYLSILDLTFEVAKAIKDVLAPDPRLPDCQQLTTKLFLHAASLYWLSNGTKTPAPKSKGGISFFDFASTAVIVRAALETYLTLFEVFFEPTSDDEFEFRHALWQLSGFIVLEDFVPSDPSLNQDYLQAQQDIAILRQRITQTKHFIQLNSKQKKEILQGKRVRKWHDIAHSAGFGIQFIRRIYALYSSYVHADGLSASQIFAAETADKQREYIQNDMLTLLLLMSKLIVEYTRRFPESKAVCERFPGVYRHAQIWSNVVSQIP